MKRNIFGVFFLTFSFLVLAAGCSDSKKTGAVPADVLYKSASAPIEKRIDDLISRMTLDEKIGQMTQIARDNIRVTDIRDLYLGSVLSGGGSSPQNNSPSGWADMVDSYQAAALATRLSIPIIYGVDSVHGNNNMRNATVFPHNIGLGATGDADLVERIGKASALETAAAGVHWTFAPCLAIGRDPRWGRFYESFGQDSALVTSLGAAFIRGFTEADTGSAVKMVTTAKHFLGDGGTTWGTSKTGNYKIDQGDTKGDDAYLRTVLLPPYVEAVKAGTRTVMISFSSWNGLKMHAQKKLITDILKVELGFTGFVVSDWAGMDQISGDYYTAMVTGINAGVDMNMVPYDARKFITTMKKAVEAKDIPMKRIDDAVRRILRVKFEMGLFEKPKANRDLAKTVRSPEHLALAREAVAKSLVVLENNGALPLDKSAKKIYVAGIAADNIGMQCGGWTLTWQGLSGNNTDGSSILGGIKEKLPHASVIYDAAGTFDGADRKAPCVIVTGERPYAEGMGDSATIALSKEDLSLIARARAKFNRVVLVVTSGRPLVLGDAPSKVDALVAAWLPGTEGVGVADVLFGDVKPTGKLSFAWPVSVDQLPLDRFISGEQKPLYSVGYGLSY